MPPRSAPTARQQRLGTELRRMREDAGLSIQEAADRLGINRTHITNLELARFGVSEERVRTLAAIYACPDTAYIDALAAMTHERKGGWWEEYRGLIATGGLDLAEMEYYAASLRVVGLIHIPGLLQTEEYAHAVMGQAVPPWSPPELRRRLSHRMKRRDILDRDAPPLCSFIIHEAALHTRFGGTRVLRAQLERLLEASERENVTVRVIPLVTDGFPVAGSTVTYASGPVPQLDTVQFDSALGSMFLDAESQLRKYRGVLDHTVEVALPVDESRDLVRAVARRLR
ncbi:Scr1 family TA system antitoxin-like transcriptional regulator [Streptomyces sp. NBS 14/10]|uniref:Scr1 family TA system antitoxin-like transcriptional regulator n=1 Tax=Streptomyces sp. NBS 14/10 TaxID=1945643 RepID=UPI000B7C67F8|nr:Scr1 family TA system antitoxin-like transcriptional regulator [Streptomyces sp. NBS 14/10]KAK1179941.1 Scr1 family TA system antitoxin-like transcriptional regulator [Streptomyces sp. NBS 14/10]